MPDAVDCRITRKRCEALCCGACGAANISARLMFPVDATLSIDTGNDFSTLFVRQTMGTNTSNIASVTITKGVMSTTYNA